MDFVARLFRVVKTLLRELSDERAYVRYLDAKGTEHTPEQWRQFSDHKQAERLGRPNCGC